jgi:hypothetical protein
VTKRPLFTDTVVYSATDEKVTIERELNDVGRLYEINACRSEGTFITKLSIWDRFLEVTTG